MKRSSAAASLFRSLLLAALAVFAIPMLTGCAGAGSMGAILAGTDGEDIEASGNSKTGEWSFKAKRLNQSNTVGHVRSMVNGMNLAKVAVEGIKSTTTLGLDAGETSRHATSEAVRGDALLREPTLVPEGLTPSYAPGH
jgi:hypothetical protein